MLLNIHTYFTCLLLLVSLHHYNNVFSPFNSSLYGLGLNDISSYILFVDRVWTIGSYLKRTVWAVHNCSVATPRHAALDSSCEWHVNTAALVDPALTEEVWYCERAAVLTFWLHFCAHGYNPANDLRVTNTPTAVRANNICFYLFGHVPKLDQ